MLSWIFAKIFQIAIIVETYKGNLWGANFQTAGIRSKVRQFWSNFFLQVTLLQSTKSQEVSGYLFYLKNLAIARRKKCGSLGPPPCRVDRVKHQLKTSNFHLKLQFNFNFKVQLQFPLHTSSSNLNFKL